MHPISDRWEFTRRTANRAKNPTMMGRTPELQGMAESGGALFPYPITANAAPR